MARSRFQAPRVVRDFSQVQQALLQVQEALDEATGSRAILKVNTQDFALVAGGFHRVSSQSTEGMKARLPSASGENLGSAITISLENMRGSLTVYAAPGQTVNGAATATFSTDGVVVFWSNGVRTWTSTAELPAESPGGAALDAEYVLGAAHGSLPNGRVATDTAEIDAVLTTPGFISWVLNAASVGFAKLANLTGLSVLGRAGTTTGVMAAITSTAARQVLQNNDAGTSLQWGHPVELRNASGTDQGDVYALRFNSGTNTTANVAAAAGVGTISYDWSGGIVQVNDVDYLTTTRTWDYNSSTSIIPVFLAAVGTEANIAFQRAALTGFAVAAQDSNATTSAEPIVTYSASANMSAERVLTSGTNTTVDVSVANQIRVNVTGITSSGALSGAVTALAGGGNTVFSGIQNGGAATNDRTNLNFIGFTFADDAINDRINITASLPVLDDGVSAGTATSLDFTSTASITAAVSGAPLAVVQLQRAALTGDVTAPANSNATTIANDAVTNAKAANMVANTIKANPTASTADPQDFAISANNFPARVGGNLVSHPFSTLAGAGLGYDGAGTIDIGADAASHLTTTASNVRFSKSRQRHYWFEDFDVTMATGTLSAAAGATTLVPAGETTWFLGGVSGSAQLEPQTPADNHVGIWRLSCGAVNGNVGLLFRGYNEQRFDEMRAIEFVVRIPTVTTIGWNVGITDGVPTNANGIVFMFDTTAFGTTVRTRTAEAAVTTDTDTGFTLVANAWNVYTMIQDTPGTVDFYIDDVLEATHATNVPDLETGGVNVVVYTRTSAARTLDIDYCAFESNSLGARTS